VSRATPQNRESQVTHSMTLEEAQQLRWSFNQTHSKLFIEWADIRQETDGSYSLVVEPVEGEQQIFTDAEKAHWALVEWMAKSGQANDRFFTLSEDGTPKECDRETWQKDWANREKTRTKTTCSPEIEATISFIGHAPSMVHMDENVKLWSASFCITAKNEHYGGITFNGAEEAKTFVDRYSAKGCPASGFPFMQFLAEYNSGPQSG
jgi:hypothetical protein